jgi:iron-sulfur cluster assembly protein
LALVLDEPNDMDEVFEFNGYKFIANKDLLAQAQPVTVDFKGVGFQITSNLEMADGCTSCGTGGTCG